MKKLLGLGCVAGFGLLLFHWWIPHFTMSGNPCVVGQTVEFTLEANGWRNFNFFDVPEPMKYGPPVMINDMGNKGHVATVRLDYDRSSKSWKGNWRTDKPGNYRARLQHLDHEYLIEFKVLALLNSAR